MPASAGGFPTGDSFLQPSPSTARLDTSRRRTVASIALIPKIVRVNLLRRHPIALGLLVLLIVSGLQPLPPLLDAVTGTVPAGADPVPPATSPMLATPADVRDARPLLRLARA